MSASDYVNPEQFKNFPQGSMVRRVPNAFRVNRAMGEQGVLGPEHFQRDPRYNPNAHTEPHVQLEDKTIRFGRDENAQDVTFPAGVTPPKYGNWPKVSLSRGRTEILPHWN
jgi:hypothetical protein